MTALHLGRVFAAMVLAAAILVTSDVQPVSGQLPAAPQVTTPKLPVLPSLPKLQSPAQLPRVPDPVPQAPLPKLPVPQVRTPVGGPGQLPGTPDRSASGPSTPGLPGVTAPSRAGRPGPSASRAARTRSAARSRRRIRAEAPPRTPSERRFRRIVTRLWACSYAIKGIERRVLVLRAGLDGRPATSVTATARHLQVSPRRVRQAQGAGLRRLRRANSTDGCAMATPVPADLVQAVAGLLAAATVPQLTRLADVRQTPPGADAGGVLAEQVASDGPGRTRRAAPSRAATTLAAGEGDGTFPLGLLLIVLLLLAASATVVVLRRRDGQADEFAPVAIAPVTVEEPSGPPQDPAPPDHPAKDEEALPMAPWTPPRETASRRQPGDDAPAPTPTASGVRRAAGVAASGMISLAVGLLVRARRRR